MNYLIWANIYLAVFYCFYWFFLRKETFFQVNRWYLLSSSILPFVLPLLDLKEHFFSQSSEQLFSTFGLEAQVNQVIIPSVNAENDWFTTFSGSSILIFIYIAGCLFSFIRLLYQSILIKRHLPVSYPGQAYSLFRIIRVDPDLIGYSKIVKHEEVHVKQLHSLDILLMELIKIFNWFNPLIYSLHRSVKLNHEYIADQVAAHNEHDRTNYAQLLFNQAFSFPIHSQTNNFFNESFIKKRITMLFKNKSKKVVLSRFFVLIPALTVIVAFQAKEPSLSNVTVIDFDESAPIETLQTDTGATFVAVETPPQPAGGMKAFMKNIADNYVYPKEALEANVKGRLLLSFVVEKDGSLSDIKVIDDLGYGTGEEAVRVLENSSKWRPGIQRGKAVRVQYTLPISLSGNVESTNSLQPVTPPTAVPAATTNTTPESGTQAPSDAKQDPENSLFLAVEEPPAPLDGMPNYLKYVGAHYSYPEAAEEAKVKGRLQITFVVEKDGSLSDIKVLKDLGFGTGEEAVRVIKDGPKWKPGIQNGKPVRVQYTLPIILNLDSDNQ